GYTAEYGGSTGGVINVITKSGTNRFSGSVLTYWQGNSISKGQNVASSVPLPGADAGGTQATGIPTLRLNPVNTDLAEYVTYPQDTWNRFEPAANVGGPIAKDRAWFWVGYQPAMTNIDRTVTLEANHQTITVNQKRQVQYLTATQTAQIGDKHRQFRRHQWRRRPGKPAASKRVLERHFEQRDRSRQADALVLPGRRHMVRPRGRRSPAEIRRAARPTRQRRPERRTRASRDDPVGPEPRRPARAVRVLLGAQQRRTAEPGLHHAGQRRHQPGRLVRAGCMDGVEQVHDQRWYSHRARTGPRVLDGG